MQEAFKEYYQLTNDEIRYLFKQAFIVLDTNVLLNFYRYSDNTTEKFFQILESLKNRLWIPYHIGKEFHNHRINEIINQKAIYTESIKEISALKSKFEDKNRNPFISSKNLNRFDLITKELKESSKKFDDYLKDDTILIRLNNLLHNGVGEDFNKEELLQIFKEGRERYKNKIPPGYADEKDKPEEIRKYGDLIIWKALISKSKQKNIPCIFITDDRKEDWWFLNKSKNIIMPLPELRKEFTLETKHLFYAYQPFSFLEKMNEIFNIDIQEEVIKEVKEVTISKADIYYKEVLILKELKAGEIAKFEIELKNTGYDFSIEVLNINTFLMTINFPQIPDIIRKFKETLNEILKYCRIKIINVEFN